MASCISNILKRFSVTAGVMLGDEDSYKEETQKILLRDICTGMISYSGR